MKVLVLVDKLNWAYHSIALAIEKFSSLNVSILPVKGHEKVIKKQYKYFDKILLMGWQLHDRVKFIGFDNVLTGIHSFHSWDNKQTTPDKDVKPPKQLIEFLSRFERVNAVSSRLFNLFKSHGLSAVVYTPNGVDTSVFQCLGHLPHKKFSIGYSGSTGHDWRKGTTDFIIPAARKAGVEAKLAMNTGGLHIPLKKMPSFYQQIDSYVCASLSEGFSLSVLESASCGRPVISTKVSGTDELIRDGFNGFLVNRDVDDIASKITLLKENSELFSSMSKNMRQFVVAHYDWSKVIHQWESFVTGD